MCSSVISEFNIQIRNLISVFRFKFLQIIYAVIKNDFEFFVSVVEDPRVTSSFLFFPSFFLLFFFSSVKIDGSHAFDHARRRIGY